LEIGQSDGKYKNNRGKSLVDRSSASVVYYTCFDLAADKEKTLNHLSIWRDIMKRGFSVILGIAVSFASHGGKPSCRSGKPRFPAVTFYPNIRL
jgi:hypothetical protein